MKNNNLPELSSPVSLNHQADGTKASVAIFVAQAKTLPELASPVSLNHSADGSKASVAVFVAQ